MAVTSALTEDQLITMSQNGDRGAFKVLMGMHREDIEKLCSARVRRRADVDDAIQEALVAIWKGIDGFERRSRFSTWVYRVTLSAISAMYRKSVPEPAELDGDGIRDGWSEPGQLATSAVSVRWALLQLPPPFRGAIILADLLGVSHREIAEIQEVSEVTVRTRVHRARHALGRLLEDER